MSTSLETYSKISIINPIRNVERTLEKNLQTLVNLDYPREKMEIILADGGSTDKTIEIIKKWQKNYPFIKLAEIPNCKSPGEARNAALKVTTGEYILFTDGDCAPRKDWALRLLAPFLKDKNIGMVGGEILTLKTDPNNLVEAYCEQTFFLRVSGRCGVTQAGYYPDIKKDLPHEVNGNVYSPFFATANAAICNQAAEKIGKRFWDEITSEDVDFSLRILKSGFRLYFEPAAIVEHMHRVTLKAFNKQLYGYGYGHPLAVLKHSRKVLEFCFQHFGSFSVYIPFPMRGIIYIGDFHLMHLFGLIFFGSLSVTILKHIWIFWTILFGCLFVLFLVRYFAPMLKLAPFNKFFTWCKIRYISNWALMLGGFKGMRTFGVIYIESSW